MQPQRVEWHCNRNKAQAPLAVLAARMAWPFVAGMRCHGYAVVTIDSRTGAVTRHLEYCALPRASAVTLVWRT